LKNTYFRTLNRTVGIIGAGRLGGCLAKRLSDTGNSVKFVASLDKERAEYIAKMVNAKIVDPPYLELSNAELVFLTVPDQAIEAVAKTLADANIDWRGKHICHCSGAYTSEIINPFKTRGAKILAFHPLQTFTLKVEPEKLQNIYYALEGDDLDYGCSLAASLGGKVIIIRPEHRALYHASACAASNYLYALLMAAAEMMQNTGASRKEALDCLMPLVMGTISNIQEYASFDGLTGPIARADTATIEKHLSALGKYPRLLRVYQALGIYLARNVKLEQKEKEKIVQLLNL